MMKKSEMYFYQLLRDFLTDHLIIRRNYSEKTALSYRQAFNLLRHYFREEKGIRFDQMDFSCFSRSNIYDYLLWLKDTRNNSVSTLNLRLSAIKSFLKYCGEEDLELMPFYLGVSSIHAFKGVRNPRIDYLTQKQLKNLFSVPDVTTRLGRRNRFFLILAYESGARLQELLDLKVSNAIRNEAGVRLQIHGKGKKIRYVPLMKGTIKHLDAYLAEFHKETHQEAFLFYTVHDSIHTQMKPGTVDYFMKQYGHQANEADSEFPKGLHSHMLRHSVAMTMHKKGIPISYIRDFLGHSSIETTSIYSYADEETIAKALGSIDHEPYIKDGTSKSKNWKGQEQYLLEYCGFH
jgi:integrase/recombinase XerD